MSLQAYNKQDPNSIRTLFASIAKRYDVGNAALSMRLYKRWNRQLVDKIRAHGESKELLDLCCGTGDIALAYLKQVQKAPETIYLIDFCAEMVEFAKQKLAGQTVDLHYIVGDAQEIPLPSASVDAVTIAYGIRNVANPIRCITEVFRVLRPGGRLGILELTRPANPLMRFGHSIYLKTMVPLVGRLLTSNRQAYEYLQRSIQRFIPVQDLQQMLVEAGFVNTSVTPLCGGIATIVVGDKR